MDGLKPATIRALMGVHWGSDSSMVEKITRVFGTGGIVSVDPKSPADKMSEIIPTLTPPQLAALRDYLTRSAADIVGIRSDVDRDVLAGKMRFMARMMEDSILKRQQQGGSKDQSNGVQNEAGKGAPASGNTTSETSQNQPPLRIA
jgi:hypothetical protein